MPSEKGSGYYLTIEGIRNFVRGPVQVYRICMYLNAFNFVEIVQGKNKNKKASVALKRLRCAFYAVQCYSGTLECMTLSSTGLETRYSQIRKVHKQNLRKGGGFCIQRYQLIKTIKRNNLSNTSNERHQCFSCIRFIVKSTFIYSMQKYNSSYNCGVCNTPIFIA